MKKLIAVVMMLLAFTAANAQDNKQASHRDAAKKDVAALMAKVQLDATLKEDMMTLMLMKHDMLASAKTAADKQKVYDMVEHKVLTGLTAEQAKAVAADKDLIKQLSH